MGFLVLRRYQCGLCGGQVWWRSFSSCSATSWRLETPERDTWVQQWAGTFYESGLGPGRDDSVTGSGQNSPGRDPLRPLSRAHRAPRSLKRTAK
eukprot:1872604-Rhodomonas_salina.1